jgi:radical SAM protein with 4Fe4S-binding SPASM domain
MNVRKRFSRAEVREALASSALRHEKYGDLSRFDAVVLPSTGSLSYPDVADPLYIHLTATMRCNARCKGCISSAVTFKNSSPSGIEDTVPERDVEAIARLVERDHPGPVTVCIYGGEPLLVPDKLVRVISLLRRRLPERHLRFMIYTNGELLGQAVDAAPRLGTDVWLYSVSIDGGVRQHNEIRRGTDLGRIRENLRALKRGYKGEILMWSTLREEQSLTDCFDEFMRLHDEGLVNHFFWHWVEESEPMADLETFAAAYENGLRNIMETYVARLEGGELFSIVHVNELILYYLTGKKRNSSACGVELAHNYDIVGGQVRPCADLPPEYTLGRIEPDGTLAISEKNLAVLVDYKRALGCYECGVHSYCGGRCPVQALTGKVARIVQYCQLMRLHVALVGDYVGKIERALARHSITGRDLWARSASYAQLTDVTP